jgi:NADPH-dependent F420 reductase
MTDALLEIRSELTGKPLVSAVVPLDPEAPGTWRPPRAGSAALEAQLLLGRSAAVVTAFQNVAAGSLADRDSVLENDVLVCGDDEVAKAAAVALVEAAGLRAWDAGSLANSAVVEGLTAVLIDLDRRYRGRHAGLKLVGLAHDAG